MKNERSAKSPGKAARNAASKSTKGGEALTRASRATREDIREQEHRVPTHRPQRD